MSGIGREIYTFDKFMLDVSERILLRDSERISLPEKAFDTLCALVRHVGRLVSKDELLNEVWADAIVEENNLDKNISLLRQVLGERSGDGKFIETVRGHGYRFVADVKQVELQQKVNSLADPEVAEDTPISKSIEPSVAPRPRSRVALAVLGLLIASFAALLVWRQMSPPAAGGGSVQSIAVLPFKALVTKDRNEALELGMAETLISKLSRSENIRVRPLSSVRRYIDLDQDSVAAGGELKVESVLDGTIQTAGGRVRVSAKLIRVGDGKQLWAGQFDEKFTDIFAVQDSISERVAAALQVRLGDNPKKRYTESAEAYQLYMKGRFHVLKTVKSETETAAEYFRQAIDADPNYALAYVGLADAYRGLAVGGEMRATEMFPKAKAAAKRAVEIDGSLAEAHAVLGIVIFWYDWDWNAAEAEFRRALELDPGSADALQFYSHLLSTRGHHAEALEKIKLARELDPINLRINTIEGMLLLYAGKTDEAVTSLQKTLELDAHFRLANMMMARALTEKGMYEEAIVATRRSRDISAESSEPLAYGAYPLARSGRLVEARAALNELLEQSKIRWVPPYNIALAYNALGETSTALDYLEKAFAEKDSRMVFLKVEPKWANLRDEPRFVELIRRMNF